MLLLHNGPWPRQGRAQAQSQAEVLTGFAQLAFATGDSVATATPGEGNREGVRHVASWSRAVTVGSTGCAHAPAVDVLGSFFPIWIFCILIGILATVFTRRLLLRFGTDYDFGPPVLIYPSLAILFACLFWLLFFR